MAEYKKVTPYDNVTDSKKTQVTKMFDKVDKSNLMKANRRLSAQMANKVTHSLGVKSFPN